MKKLVLFTIICLMATMASAATVTVDGINYSTNGLGSAKVIKSPDAKGDIVIPATIKYNRTICAVTEIADSAFMYNDSITSFTIDSNNAYITEIPKRAFYNCRNLTKVNIRNVTTIKEYAFYKCPSLSSIDLSNVKSIGEYSMNYCGLTSVSIGAKCTQIGNAPFCDCPKLNSITVDKDNPNYDSRNNCNAIIETETNKLIQGCNTTVIPDDVQSIGTYAFKGCIFENIDIPNSITSIGDFAFCGNEKLKSIVLPPHINSILNLFGDCPSLKSVSIQASVTSIRLSAFKRDDNLSTVVVNWTTPLELDKEVFATVKDGIFIVPTGTRELYRNAKGYENFTTIIEHGSSSSVDEDVNKDGDVNSLDVLKVYKYMQSH